LIETFAVKRVARRLAIHQLGATSRVEEDAEPFNLVAPVFVGFAIGARAGPANAATAIVSTLLALTIGFAARILEANLTLNASAIGGTNPARFANSPVANPVTTIGEIRTTAAVFDAL